MILNIKYRMSYINSGSTFFKQLRNNAGTILIERLFAEYAPTSYTFNKIRSTMPINVIQ